MNRAILYWEYEQQVAVRKGNWKLYDISTDTMEMKDLASEKPELVQTQIAEAEAPHDLAATGT